MEKTEVKLNRQEKAAINALKKLEKKWPKSLWLFSGGGDLCVMRFNENGEIATTKTGSVDDDYIVEHIAIINDGGDW